jgi:hypothetical protein
MKSNCLNKTIVAVGIAVVSVHGAIMAADPAKSEAESERIPRTAAQSKIADLPIVAVNTTVGKALFTSVTMREVAKYGETPYYAFRFKTPKVAGTFIWGFNYRADPDIFYMAVVPAEGLRLENPGQTPIMLKSNVAGVGKKGEMLSFERYHKGIIKPDTEYIIYIGREKNDPILKAVILNVFQGVVPELYEQIFPSLDK